MHQVKFFVIASLLLSALTSCTYYNGPQPVGAPNLSAFPREMQGTYTNDEAKLVISHDKIEYWVDKNKGSMKASIGDSLFVRNMSPWTIVTRMGVFASGGNNYTVFALKLDEKDHNILHGVQTDDEDIKAKFPNVARTVEKHSVTTSDGIPDPVKDVNIFDPTREEFRQIIEAAFDKKRQEADYKGFTRQ